MGARWAGNQRARVRDGLVRGGRVMGGLYTCVIMNIYRVNFFTSCVSLFYVINTGSTGPGGNLGIVEDFVFFVLSVCLSVYRLPPLL